MVVEDLQIRNQILMKTKQLDISWTSYKEINNNQVIEIRTTCTKSNIKQ